MLHSLWQGLLMAVLAGVIVLFTKRLKPGSRYAIFTGLLAAFIITVAITFNHELNVFANKTVAATAVQQPVLQAGIPAATISDINYAPASTTQLTVTEKLLAFFTANANAIVLGWLFIIAFRCVQMLVGLRGVYILKHKGLADAGEYWNRRLTQLAASLRVNQNIALFQSAIAKVPMVIGHFKPVILLPAGIITALPQDEIEAILLHELAHIRRKDYLVNMLQNFCEILFFFNPAVLWLSGLIKDERENCCDDIALQEVKSKKQFIHALISFQEYKIAANKYAPGFPGKKDHLLHRVKRIITNNNKTLSNMEKTFLATGIVLVSFITITFAQTKKNTPSATKQAAKQEAYKQDVANNNDAPPATAAGEAEASALDEKTTAYDTMPPQHDGKYTVNIGYEGKRYEIVYDNEVVVELTVDGEKIPSNKIADYKTVTDTILQKMKEQQRRMAMQQRAFAIQQEQFRKQQEIFEEQRRHMEAERDSLGTIQRGQQMELYKKQQEQYKEQQKLFRQQQEKYRQLRDSLKDYSDNDFGPMVAPVPPVAPVGPGAPVMAMAGVGADMAPPPSPATPALAPLAPYSADVAPMASIAGPRFAPHAPMAPPLPIAVDYSKADEIMDYLEDHGVKLDRDDVSINLDNNGLTVNGVKQPESISGSLKDRFIKHSKDHIIYKTHKTGDGGHATSSDIYTDNKSK